MVYYTFKFVLLNNPRKIFANRIRCKETEAFQEATILFELNVWGRQWSVSSVGAQARRRRGMRSQIAPRRSNRQHTRASAPDKQNGRKRRFFFSLQLQFTYYLLMNFML